MTYAEMLFDEKAQFNSWLNELTESEKQLIIELINEGMWFGANNTDYKP